MLTSDLLPQHPNLAFLRQELSWAWSLSTDWMDSKPRDSSVSAFSVLGLHVQSPRPAFYVSSCGLNSGHYVCMAMFF